MPVKQQIGIVISNKMQKSIVKIEKRYPHPMYSKILIKLKKLAHDELGM
jgi:ribosomal protein S17